MLGTSIIIIIFLFRYSNIQESAETQKSVQIVIDQGEERQTKRNIFLSAYNWFNANKLNKLSKNANLKDLDGNTQKRSTFFKALYFMMYVYK